MRTWTTVGLVVMSLAVAIGVAMSAKPGKPKIGGNGPIDRPTNHSGFWCFNEWTKCGSAPPDSFIADGDSATVVWRVAKYYSGDQTTTIDFHLDNVVVLTRAAYDANLGVLVGFDGWNCLGPGTGVALDYFPLLPQGVVYHTNFDGSIGPEWSYDPAEVSYATTGTYGSAPMYDDPFVVAPATTGSMDIGTHPGSGEDFVEVTLQLTGLQEGTEYVVTYWSGSKDDDVEGGCPEPLSERDDYEVTIYGETTICIPDPASFGFEEVRTLSWNPITKIWTFQAKFKNNGPGVAVDILATLDGPQTVTVLEDAVPVGYLGITARSDKAWGEDTFTLDLSNHFSPFTVVQLTYDYTDDCGNPASTNAVTILGDPTAYPTSAPSPAAVAQLGQNYPNPFNPSTVLPVTLTEATPAQVSLFDVQGRHVRTLHDGRLPEGTTELRWNGRNDDGHSVAAGTYFARLRIGERTQVRRLVLLK